MTLVRTADAPAWKCQPDAGIEAKTAETVRAEDSRGLRLPQRRIGSHPRRPLPYPSRYLLVGSVVLCLVGVAALQTTLARGPDEPTHAWLSPGLKVGVAVLIGALGVIDLGWGTHALLILLPAGLAVPMVYGALVWFSHPEAQRVADLSRSESQQ